MAERPHPPIEYISQVRRSGFPEEWYGLSSARHFWFQWRLTALLCQMRDLGLPMDCEKRALEIGCGTGVLTQQLEQLSAWRVDGTDLNPEALAHHSTTRGRILYYDVLEEREQFMEAYDCLLIFDVLEHLQDTRSFWKAALKHLKPGGYVLVNVPAIKWLYSSYDAAAGHYRRYDRCSLREECAGLPIEILDIRCWGLSLAPLLVLRKELVCRQESARAVIRRGFAVPNAFVHGLLRLLMRLETALVKRPLFGTSLLLAARKVGQGVRAVWCQGNRT